MVVIRGQLMEAKLSIKFRGVTDLFVGTRYSGKVMQDLEEQEKKRVVRLQKREDLEGYL